MCESDRWARSFYRGLFVDLWLGATSEEQTREEVDFLEEVLHLPARADVLDLACGGGRHCLELSARGHEMTGLDISPEFLDVARANATSRGLTVSWKQGTMLDLPWNAAFDGAICMGNSLGGLDELGIKAFFQGVARALRPGSKMVVETGFVAESILPNLREGDEGQARGIHYQAHRHYDHLRSRLEIDYTFTRGGEIETKSGFGQVYTYKSLCALIAEAGFDAVKGFGSTDGKPFRCGSPNLLLVGTKSAG